MLWVMRPLVVLLVVLLASTPLLAGDLPDAARMNQVQVLGSHNSYKEAIDASLWELLNKDEPGRFNSLEYRHQSLTRQLDIGLRKLELDVVHDPEGGRYAKPLGIEMVEKAGLPVGSPYDPEGLMLKPGLKVLHVPDIDFRSNVYTFNQALKELKIWSNAHPRHLPIAITMNAKQGGIERAGFTQPLPFDKAAFDAWDDEIRAVMPASKLITPDVVRGDYPTLNAAVLAQDWPTLADARGKFLFVLDERGDAAQPYLEGHPSLRGRVMFVDVPEGTPESAFLIINDPVKDFRRIQHAVRSGYLVRTRADADTRNARAGDYSQYEAALASGAHFISTDYYVPNPDFGTGYQIELPCGCAAQWNPLMLPVERPLPALE